MVKGRKIARKANRRPKSSGANSTVLQRLQKKNALRQPPKKLVLAMIVKNESKIITRLLDSIGSVLDFVCITDTGSEDNTVELIENWGRDHNLPTTVCHDQWQDFKYNRTKCIKNAQETYPEADYILLSDADFIWHVKDHFDKHLLFKDRYDIYQFSDLLKYTNTRMINARLEWEYRLRTHEYITVKGDTSHTRGELKGLEIEDREDGGCKDDKFERDERLLKLDLEDPDVDEDDKTRARFYLARTLTDMKRYSEAIVAYRDRIKDGGFVQEVYYSKYQIGVCYEQLARIKLYLSQTLKKDESERNEYEKNYLEKHIAQLNLEGLTWGQLQIAADFDFEKADDEYWNAYEYRPSRAEALLKCAAMHRDLFHSQRAYDIAQIGKEIKMSADSLFVEKACYTWNWDMEIMLTACYIGKPEESRAACSRLIDLEGTIPDWAVQCAKNNAHHFN